MPKPIKSKSPKPSLKPLASKFWVTTDLKERQAYGLIVQYRADSSDERVLAEVIDNSTGLSYRKKCIDFDVKKGEHWLDLGANIGAFALYCYGHGATADCYEPDPDCFALLKSNIGKLEGFKVLPTAVTHLKERMLSFYKGKGDRDFYRYSIMKTKFPYKELPNTYAGPIFKKHYDGVKMDIEGAELGLFDAGLVPNCDKLCIEYHFSRDKCMKNFHKRMKVLRKHFKTVKYPPQLDRGYPGDKFPGFFDRLIFCKK